MFVKLSFGDEADTSFSFMQFVVISAKISGLFWGCWVYKDSAKILKNTRREPVVSDGFATRCDCSQYRAFLRCVFLSLQRSICECWLTIQSLVDFLPGVPVMLGWLSKFSVAFQLSLFLPSLNPDLLSTYGGWDL